jgi:P-type Cu+ transporter
MFGMLAFSLLLAVYFGSLTLISDWEFALGEFTEFGYYIVLLAAGFGLQVALYTHLRQLLHQPGQGRTVMAASGATSTLAMLSCCSHYLVNILPVLGVTGLVTFAMQYQIEFFWVGLAFNAGGILFIGNKLFKATKEHQKCAIA